MAELQKASGYTQLSNKFIRHILNAGYPFSKLDVSVILTVFRFTIGYQRTEFGMSLSFIASYLNARKSHISESLKFLISSNVIKEVEPEKGIRPRVLSVNANLDEWTFTKKEKPKKNESSPFRPVTPSGTLEFPSKELLGFLSSELTGFPEEEPINKRIKENNKKIEEEEEEGNNILSTSSNSSAAAAAASSSSGISSARSKMNISFSSPELSKKIYCFYRLCFSYHPNCFEIEAIKKEILQDKRFLPAEIYPIVGESFQKVAVYPKDKRNTQYLLGVIKSMKKELFIKMEKQKAEEIKQIALDKLKKTQSEYVPGTFMKYYNEAMEYAGKLKEQEK